jgi:hypothetical protein
MSTDYSDDRVRIRQLFRNESEMRCYLALRTKMFRTLRPTRVIWRDFASCRRETDSSDFVAI